MSKFQPPRDDLVRACYPGAELRGLSGFSLDNEGHVRAAAGDAPVMAGHFSVFNTWSEINSLFEGRFMEQFAPGAFKKTLSENRDGMRSIFQHGRDPQVGDKPLGPIDELKEDQTGPYFEVSLLEASYVRDLVLPGLRANLYGVSFRFRIMREEIVDEPEASAHNPNALPERTVKEVQVREFGPVTYPAYPTADIGVRSVRSLTDQFIDPRDLTKRFVDEALRDARAAMVAAGLDPEEVVKAASENNGGKKPPEEKHDATAPESSAATTRTAKGPGRDYLDPKESQPSWKL